MNTLDMARLATLLDAYGADPQRWPEPERDAALALLRASEPARILQRAAAALDAKIDAWAVPPHSAALRAAVIASAPPHRGWRQGLTDLWRDLGGWQLAGPAFAASLALGALLPMWLGDAATDLPDEDLIAAMQLVDELPEWTP